MINGIDNLIETGTTQEAKKQTGTETIPGGFEALLAILLNQGISIPGNNANGLQDILGQVAEESKGNINNILDVLNTPVGGSSSLKVLDALSDSSIFEGLFANKSSDTGQSVQELLKAYTGSIPEGVDLSGISEDIQGEPGITGVQGASDENPDNSLKIQMQTVNISEDIVSPNSIQQKDIAGVISNPTSDNPVPTANGGIPENLLKAVDKSSTDLISENPQDYPNPLKKVEVIEGLSEMEGNPYNLKQNKTSTDGSTDTFDNQFAGRKPGLAKLMKNSEDIRAGLDLRTGAFDKAITEEELKQGIVKETSKKNINLNQNIPEKLSDEQSSMPQFVTNSRNTITRGEIQQSSINSGELVRTNREDILNQIFDKISVTNGKDISEMNLKLRPQELGEVSIKLIMEKGMMVGRILVENSQVKSLIESNLPQIKENLKMQNANVSDFSVSVGLKQDSQSFNQNFSSNRWAQNRNGFVEKDGQAAAQEIVPRSYGGSGLLNLLA